MVLTNLEKDEADRLAISDHLNFLETELTRHATTALLFQEAIAYLGEAAASKTQLIGNQKNMRHHAPKGTDMTAHIDEYNKLLAKATRLHAGFHGIKMSFPVTSTPTPSPTSSTTATTHSIKLPTLEIPKFGGNLQEWVSFRDLFTSVIDKSSLSKVDKLTHLKSLVTGEAARQIRNIVLSDANYEVAWKSLSERYENNRELLFSLLKRLFNQPAIISESATALRSLIDTTKECVRSLEVLARPVQHWDDILLYTLITKLDPTSRAHWEQTLNDTSIPDLPKIYEFLEQRARALEACPVQKPQIRPLQQPRVRAHHTDIKCPLGCPKTHPLYMCQEFRKMTPQQRLSEVKRLNRCLNCLTDGHQSSACPSKHACKTCHRKHNTMLHLGQDGGNQPRSSPHQPDVQSHHIYQSNSINAGMLATALVRVAPAGGVNLRRALIDGGSTNSFITERAAREMKLSLRPAHIPTSGLQSSSCGTVKHVTSFTISPHFNSFSYIPVTALVVKSISSRIPSEKLKKTEWTHLKHLKSEELADPSYHLPESVDILVGTEIFWSILDNDKIEGASGQPVAVKSSLGWLVAGANKSSTPVSVFNVNVDLNAQLARFWDQETLEEETKMTNEETECEAHFAATHKRDDMGRFTVSLPFKPVKVLLGASRNAAVRRFLILERKFTSFSQSDMESIRKLKNQWNEYKDFMREYEELGHMMAVPPEEVHHSTSPTYYIPHHSVTKESSTTTKLRVVFDASAKTSSGASLNDCLMVGPPLQDHITDIMLRFRTHTIAFTADIAKMYRQIRVTEADVDRQRIIWRDDPSKPLQDYRLLTVTYGTASAPYQAVKCLQQLAIDEQQRYPDASKIALRDFYVDDTASGCASLDDAKRVVQQLQDLCMSGGFSLRKWTTNSQELLDTIPEDLRETNSLVEMQHHDSTIKTLGVFWNPTKDKYLFKVILPPDMPGTYTKRIILSEIARIYDPLGWLAPVIISCKIFMQDLWKLKADWDDNLPDAIQTHWTTLKESLVELSMIEIPRCVTKPCPIRIVLVGCCDASIKAISAALYVYAEYEIGDPTCHLLTSKTRVAPSRLVTLPRLELGGAVLVSELLKSTIKAIHINFDEVRAFTDSTIALHWINSNATRWKPYIRRRVQAIQENCPVAKWFHIPGEANPADCASRGIPAEALINHPLWWNGSTYFSSPSITADLIDDDIAIMEKEVQHKVHSTEVIPLDPLFTRFSSFKKLQRVTAYVIRFLNNWTRQRRCTPIQRGHLTVSELKTSHNFIIRHVQHAAFPLEMTLINAKKPLPKGNPFLNLQPFLCPAGLLRVGGRLRNADISYDSKHQMLLPKSHAITASIIWDLHLNNYHLGPAATLAAVQQRYWIVNGRDTIRYLLKKCVTCTKHRAKMMTQVMGDLPFSRVNPSRPFSKVGVDYAGPFLIRPMVRSKVTLKCWIAVFVCFSTRAIHIEVVSSLSTDAFLAAFRRFCSRRGVPCDVFSDCGTNFKSSSTTLKEFYLIASQDAVQTQMTSQGISWHFNPAGAPHFGGLWEAGVKSIKLHLTKVMGTNKPTYEEMQTLLVQIEGILNSRPLVPASADPSDLGVLTPAHFLIGSPITAVPEPCLMDLRENHLKRWQLLQQQQQRFWKRWSNEFITRLQQRPKWWTPAPNLAVGHLVIIKDENLPPLKWKMGRVVAVHPGKDGHVRVATLKTANGELKRPIVKELVFVTCADWWTHCGENCCPVSCTFHCVLTRKAKSSWSPCNFVGKQQDTLDGIVSSRDKLIT